MDNRNNLRRTATELKKSQSNSNYSTESELIAQQLQLSGQVGSGNSYRNEGNASSARSVSSAVTDDLPKTYFINDPLIVSCGIGEYDNGAANLPSVEVDYKHMINVFHYNKWHYSLLYQTNSNRFRYLQYDQNNNIINGNDIDSLSSPMDSNSKLMGARSSSDNSHNSNNSNNSDVNQIHQINQGRQQLQSQLQSQSQSQINVNRKYNDDGKLYWDKNDIIKLCEKARELILKYKHDSLMFVISGHGNSRRQLMDSKMNKFSISDIFDVFCGDYALHENDEMTDGDRLLFTQPAIFIIDACRGSDPAPAYSIPNIPVNLQQANGVNINSMKNESKENEKKENNTSNNNEVFDDKALNHNLAENKEEPQTDDDDDENESESKMEGKRTNVSHRDANRFEIWANTDGYAVRGGQESGGLLIRSVRKVFNDMSYVERHVLSELFSKIKTYVRRYSDEANENTIDKNNNNNYNYNNNNNNNRIYNNKKGRKKRQKMNRIQIAQVTTADTLEYNIRFLQLLHPIPKQLVIGSNRMLLSSYHGLAMDDNINDINISVNTNHNNTNSQNDSMAAIEIRNIASPRSIQEINNFHYNYNNIHNPNPISPFYGAQQGQPQTILNTLSLENMDMHDRLQENSDYQTLIIKNLTKNGLLVWIENRAPPPNDVHRRSMLQQCASDPSGVAAQQCM